MRQQPFASPEEALACITAQRQYQMKQHLGSPTEALAHFGIKGMRWGFRKERDPAAANFGEPYSSASGLGHGSKVFELKRQDELRMKVHGNIIDVQPKEGFRSPLVKERHDELLKAAIEFQKQYPALRDMKIEIVPMSNQKGMTGMIWGKCPAAAAHLKDGEARLFYNDKHTRLTKSQKAVSDRDQPGVATIPDYIGRHEMGHVMAMSKNIMPSGWESTHKGTYEAFEDHFQQTNTRHKEVMDKHGLTFKEVSNLSRYAATQPAEAFAESVAHYHTPEFRAKMPPATQAKIKAMLDDVGGTE